jgi:RNA polymerase sigma-70 factor, ECF subfamily
MPTAVASTRGRRRTVADPDREPGDALDRAVLERFVAGDSAALAEVYRRYSRPVWGLAMAVLHDRHLAEDAATETFLRAWRAASAYDPSRPLGPWLFTLARRTALDVLRRESRPTRGGHEPEADVVIELPDISATWEAWEVRRAVVELPAEEQVVVRLAHFDGLTHAEIAAELDLPLGTVKSRSHRAHRRLASRLRHLRLERTQP